nr:MAG TPA: hypothetical protein [Caudoviricetes sp.]
MYFYCIIFHIITSLYHVNLQIKKRTTQNKSNL